MIPGQDLKTWVERLPALADALGVHQIAATRHRPGVLALVIERRMPFTFIVPATRIPELAAEVDLGAVVIGEDEYGRPYLCACAASTSSASAPPAPASPG